MDICSLNHKEIAFTTVNCPLCCALEEIEELERENSELKSEIQSISHES